MATAIAINDANQTLEIGPTDALTINAAESVTNGTIKLYGGTLTAASVGSGANLIGSGTVAGPVFGTGTITTLSSWAHTRRRP